MILRVCALFFILLLSACGEGDSSDSTELSFVTVRPGQFGNPYDAAIPEAYGIPPFEKPKFFAFQNEFTFSNFWAAIQSRNGPAQPLPAIDFTRQTVAAVFLGARPDTCYGMLIKSVREEGGSVIVQYQERSPSPFGGAGCSPAGVFPFAIIVIDHTPGPVEFEEGPHIIN